MSTESKYSGAVMYTLVSLNFEDWKLFNAITLLQHVCLFKNLYVTMSEVIHIALRYRYYTDKTKRSSYTVGLLPSTSFSLRSTKLIAKVPAVFQWNNLITNEITW